MSYIAGRNTSIFAAIGVVSGHATDPVSSPRPVSVTSTADPHPLLAGGPGAGFARIDRTGPVPDSMFWREVNRCGALDTTTEGPVTTSARQLCAGQSLCRAAHLSMTLATDGRHLPPRHRRLFAAHLREDASIRYIFLCSCGKT